MSGPRLLVPSVGAPGETVVLPDGEERHVRSRRLAEGSEVVLLDGRGGRAVGALAEGGRAVRVAALTPPRGEPARRVAMILAAAEPARVEWAIEKGTECGAAEFLLAACARSQAAHVRALAARLPRLARIAGEAVKQCDRTRVPEISPPRPIDQVLAAVAAPIWLACPGAPRPAGSPPARLALAVGPEGGFTPEEEALFARLGAVSFGLGERILRLETATVASLCLLVDLP